MKDMETKRNHIVFVHLMGDFDSVPLLRSSLDLLLEKGYRISLFFVDDQNFSTLTNQKKGVSYHPLKRLSKEKYPANFRRILEFFLWFWQIMLTGINNQYDYILGIDPIGLIIGGILGKLKRIPFSYINLEIYIKEEISNPIIRLMKIPENYFSKQAQFCVVQDETRAAIFMKANHVSNEKIALLPNAPLGPAYRIKTDFLQTRLDIPPDKTIILHAGTLADWTATPELIEAAKIWPPSYQLVLHSRQRKTELKINLEGLNERIRLSDQPVEYEQLNDLFSSADIGLVLYRILGSDWYGDNMNFVGMSSGKLAQCLRVGLPVIVSDLPGLTELVEEYKCGIAVKDVNEISQAISTIMENYSIFSKNAVRCFNEKFAFQSYFDRILERMNLPM